MPRGFVDRLAWCSAALAFSAVSLPGVKADVTLPAILADNMVLQQKRDVPLWGRARPGEEVRVRAEWMERDARAAANDEGVWRLRIDTPEAGGPYTIRVAGDNTITLENVLIGEVWICSGQSNMEWPLSRVLPGAPADEARRKKLSAANLPEVRLFDVKNTFALSPADDCEGTWVACSPETVLSFSAVGFYFGSALHSELDVPVGLIGTNWGGTPAEAWTSEETLMGMPAFAPALALNEQERRQPGLLRRKYEALLAGWWHALENADPGLAADSAKGANWAAADHDDADWDTMPVPSNWNANGLSAFDGLVWFRRIVDIPPEWAGKDLVLELGPIDDMDDTWVNGVRVGDMHTTNRWRTARRYAVPSFVLHPGRNVIAVRVLDIGGAGGFRGHADQLRLRPAGDENAEPIPLSGEWRYRVGAPLGDLKPLPRPRTVNKNSPGVLYNGMIAPLIPYAVRGTIWYQGESNRTRAAQYRTLFPRMIADWRRNWGQGDFPFYFVQIAPFGYRGDSGQAAELREAQFMALATPNTGMAVTMDIGNPRNIHPINKQDVGRRLALWALAKTYGRSNLVYSGPLFRSMRIERNAVRLSFDHVGGGLSSGGGPLTHFTIAGEDRKFVPAKAIIDGDSILVSSEDVPRPVAVRYAWGAADEPNLRNDEGLPASSFRTDDWRRDGGRRAP